MNTAFRIHPWGCVVTCFCCVLAVRSEAQANEVGADLFSMDLEDLMQVKVSLASRHEEWLVDAPSSVTVFTRDDIDALGVHYLEELLQYAPGFVVMREVEQGSGFKISARGRNTALSESVLVMQDGVRLNDLYTGGVSIINRWISLDNARQVEVIRGPGSALYGSNAFLGVVHILTGDGRRDADNERHKNNVVSVASSLPSGGTTSISNTLSMGDWQGKTFVRAFVDKGEKYDAQIDRYGQQDNTRDPVRGIELQAQLGYEQLSFVFRHMQRQLDDFMSFGALGNDINDENIRQTSLQAAWKDSIEEVLDYDISIEYEADHWLTNAALLPAGFIDPSIGALEGGPLLDSFRAGAALDARWHISDDHELDFGASHVSTGIDRIANILNYDLSFTTYYGKPTRLDENSNFNDDKTRHIFGLYVQDRYKWSDDLSMTTGLRYDRYSDFGNTLNPRLALVQRISDSDRIKLMYGEAFRAPNFLELYDRNNPVDYGNPALDPETVKTTELAYLHQQKQWQATATLFRNSIHDRIVFGSDPPVAADNPYGAASFYNDSNVSHLSGLEMEYSYQWHRGYNLRGSFTRFFDAAETLRIPKTMASVALYREYGFWRMDIDALYRGNNESIKNDDAYCLLNTAVSYAFHPSMLLKLRIRNVLDKEVQAFSTVPDLTLMERGRALEAEWQFSW